MIAALNHQHDAFGTGAATVLISAYPKDLVRRAQPAVLSFIHVFRDAVMLPVLRPAFKTDAMRAKINF
tara:strand:+ start:2563 stop:2766 length:204 start_codon:yes stop_codon:yes gene_type:complete